MPLARFCRRACSCCGCFPLDYEEKKKEESLCFEDKNRKIDYVLVYAVEGEEDKDEDEKEKIRIRELYQENLKKKGVHMETETKDIPEGGKVCFVKLHIPWHILLKYAERMRFKMPLKEEKDEDEDEDHPEDQCCDCSWSGRLKKKILYPFQLHNNVIDEKFGNGKYYTAEFSRDKIQYFDIVDKRTFFSNPDRSRIAHRIMDETTWGELRKHLGISRLLLDGVYEAAYPLHDGSTDQLLAKEANVRQLLYREWARWGRWYKFQPIDVIRYYLGDKVGLFFAWLGFYTHMLMYASGIGIFCVIYGLGTVSHYPSILEFCDPSDPYYAGNLTMCPLCDNDCTYWKLQSTCSAAKLTHIFDNEVTLCFTIFMSIWVTLFLELWKRRQFKLDYDWDLVSEEEGGSNLIRPEYQAQVVRERINPATGRKEAMMDPQEKLQRLSFSVVTVIFWLSLVVVAIFSIIIYKLVVHAVLTTLLDTTSLPAPDDIQVASYITSITSSLISLIIIMVLNKIYLKVAIWLTSLETPRTRLEYDGSFTLKVFCFQFVNFYSSLFYIAFFKNSFTGHPGRYTYLFGRYRWEGCEPGGCMHELTIQLVVIMLGKQAFSNFMELFGPWATKKYNQYKSRKNKTEEEPKDPPTRWESDFKLAPLDLLLFYEYLEMVIQFGFVVLFVSAFPLAPLMALINNIIHIRLNAIKFIQRFRRPLAFKCSSIGAWYPILEFIGTVAVVSNAFIIAVTSDTIPRLAYYYFYSQRIFGEFTYRGYVNDSLSVFNVAEFSPQSAPSLAQPFTGETVTECRYKSYRSKDPPHELTVQYWHVVAGKMAFVIVMEHVVFLFKSFLSTAIPDRSAKLVAKIKREINIVENMLLEDEKNQVLKKCTKDTKKDPKGDENTKSSNGSSVVTHENEMMKQKDETSSNEKSVVTHENEMMKQKDETSSNEKSVVTQENEKG